ncbi:hypothetical protein ONS95_000844 [Cadophora gregata]|uniref:uncharacterized protein n=1 Tax=Cadophora gregata TaxID=51156 RepID=UPI0026DAE5B0|nr:uncharacterized protein ONS95_000844 [Cadophora gregata]KAK0102966.1 hypothetical protein ONS96_005584 [Cadophora gregata f. sp. sojae]KAK0128898.1 hypothetical protein ONS95_000844 [Cadophora gregata]
MKTAAYAAVLNHSRRTSTARDDEARDRDNYSYVPVPLREETPGPGQEEIRFSTDLDAEHHILLEQHLREFRKNNSNRTWIVVMGALGVFLFFYLAIADHTIHHVNAQCDGLNGFTCSPEISHFWGQSSPYFAVASEIATEVPDQCQITFAQILSRHGARDPTAGKTIKYQALIDRIHANATSYSDSFAFIKDYKYTLGADQLTTFGQQELINSGIKFYQRYRPLAQGITPFVRASGQDRVVESAQNWTQGFHTARLQDASSTVNESLPFNIVQISEDQGQNNTLNHDLCNNFEEGPLSDIGDDAVAKWQAVFAPPITARLNENLPGVNLTDDDTVSLMDMCPFNTVANDNGTIHPFCGLFTATEWQQYDYLATVGKFYSYSIGNPLGPTQGVGFTNELIARMTKSAVVDRTTTNSTLDGNSTTFPLDAVLYADFSHDNDMMTIFSAMGLFNSTTPLSNTTLQTVQETHGFAVNRLVPFSSRAYFEKMTCTGSAEELVRVVINDRVMPLDTCGGDALGRCTLSAWVKSLSFARAGGLWDSCFTPPAGQQHVEVAMVDRTL